MNRIRDLVVLSHRLDPIETELHVHVKLEELTATTEIKGRLIGPRSAHAATIEIAYPLREIERQDNVVLRVIIPEPSWWEPKTPFLYEGPLELWQDGVLCERVTIRHGIRALQLTSKGLRLNGKPFLIRGKIVEPSLTEDAAKSLREAGFNTIWTTAPAIELWNLADRIGLFVLGSSVDLSEFHFLQHELTNHPSHFGWIFNRADLSNAPIQQDGLKMLYGVNTSARSRPEHADFLVCQESELAWLDDMDLPKLVVVKQLSDPLPTRADVIGWIESR
jgi:beta-galactosidase/beta-glucuronidase